QADRPRAKLDARGRERQDAGSPRHADRRRAARQAQARVHAAHRHGRLRRGGERREGARDREQAQGQALLPSHRPPRRAALSQLRGDAGQKAGGDHQAGSERHAAAQPACAKADHQAEDLRGARASARRPEATGVGAGRMMAEEEKPETPEAPEAPEQSHPAEPTAAEEGGPSAQWEGGPAEEQAGEPTVEEVEIVAVVEEAPPQAPASEPEPETVTGEQEGEQEAPRVKPSVPGAHLEVDIVPEGVDPLGREEAYVDPYAIEEEGEQEEKAEEEEEEIVAPIATAAIDLASGARYRATGKRKTAIARVTLRPGSGTYLVNGRTLEEHFPRVTLQRSIRQPLETVGYEERMDVVP